MIKNASKYIGKKITDIKLSDDRLCIKFLDGMSIDIVDTRQLCCENRYLTCDDDLSSLNGEIFQAIDFEKEEDIEEEYGDAHEVCFFTVQSNKSFITLCAHNEHNGYYSGINVEIMENRND